VVFLQAVATSLQIRSLLHTSPKNARESRNFAPTKINHFAVVDAIDVGFREAELTAAGTPQQVAT